jgi:hypothetical protein
METDPVSETLCFIVSKIPDDGRSKKTVILSTQEFHNVLWRPKIYYRVHKSPLLVPILTQINPVYPISLWSILVLSNLLRLGLPSGLFPSGFPTNILYAFLVSIRAIFPAHFILFNLIILYILDDEYNLWSILMSYRIVQSYIPEDSRRCENSKSSNLQLEKKTGLLFLTEILALWE